MIYYFFKIDIYLIIYYIIGIPLRISYGSIWKEVSVIFLMFSISFENVITDVKPKLIRNVLIV